MKMNDQIVTNSSPLETESHFRDGLAVQAAGEQAPAVNIISAGSRRLLESPTSPETVSQYCYPNGACDLSDLHDGLLGFVLQGEAVSDQSGISVSAAGDINGDGVADLLIGASYADPSGRPDAGKSYVVFGSSNSTAWGTGTLDLSSLINGVRGFVLQGEAASDQSGISVSTAGDVNGDGVGDLVIGAYVASPSGRSNAGKSYVVFGSRNSTAWGNGTLDLSSVINGVRGFVLQGEAVSDFSGNSVSAAGDVNGDSVADLLIGARLADPSGRGEGGKSYVVFGSRNSTAWGNGTLDLSSLMNGVRGFVLQGEAQSDSSGWSVSTAGDVNGDGVADLLIGAFLANPSGRIDAGKTYVVFGSRNSTAWGTGTLDLSSLMNGVRGFALQGEAANDWSGSSVSAAGDVNGDGFDDVLVGALYADPAGRTDAGKGYVVFGSGNSTAWGNGTLELSSLRDGMRGFVLQGETANDHTGNSVSAAGDVNGDGVADLLIGATQADPSGRSQAGKSYVVFGSRNSTIWGNGTVDLNSFLLNGVRGFMLQGEAAFDQSGFSVSAAGDVNGDGVADLVIGAYLADPSGRGQAGKSYVVFGSNPPQLWVNQMSLYRGQTLILSNQNLNATDSRPVNFNITSLSHGQFEYISNPGQAIALFNQSQVWVGQVQFVHDGTDNAPSYTVQLGNGLVKLSQNATIDFYGFGNSLTIHQAETLQMSNQYLDVITGYPADQVNITISNLQHGEFLLAPSNASVSQFLQTELLAGNILFSHDGSAFAPSYNVTINDPSRTLLSAADVTFYRRPVWLSNQLSLTQGDQLFLNASHINVTEDQPSSKVQFIINGLQHGQFKLAPANNTVTQFTQQQLLAGQILFVHDKTGLAPSYQLTVNDTYFVLPPQSAAINFTALPPMLGNNRLTALQGQIMNLTLADLNATDPDPALSDSALVFTVSNVQHGQFSIAGILGFVTQFTQAQILQGKVTFTHDDSLIAPSYQVSASNPYRNATSAAASIFFDKRPTMINNRLAIETGESVVLAPTNLQAVDDHTASAELLFTVSSVNHGYFSELQAPDINITTFSQQRVRDFEIQFTHDGSANAPSYAIKVTDGSGLDSSQTSVQINFKNTIAASGGIDLQKLYTTFSTLGGIAVAAAGYLWWRRKVASHRRGFELANNVRKAANLEYHDFMRFDGDIYKSKIENLLSKIDEIQKDFHKKLSPEQKKSFAVCIAEILEQHRLLSPSDYGVGIYGWIFAFSVGWSQQLNFKQFEAQITDIAQEAMTAWKAEEKPLTRWPYFSPTCKDKVKAFCCARPSSAGMFAQDRVRLSQTQSVSMTELKHQSIDDVSVSIARASSSPRFFGDTTSNPELALLIQQEVAKQVAKSIKPISDRVDQLEAQPLLSQGLASSS